ncbi:DUF4142 domain-containing protein [Amycolatopsis nigrescens]|uniref:DUF4142 domain-containing protein n=1 Tax=Amycolatopsis nigrescens TaxID=381445 RepID=UPI000362B6B8|nr:DUF4142 domain-containing protein [Amycolatopsis nigrescens]
MPSDSEPADHPPRTGRLPPLLAVFAVVMFVLSGQAAAQGLPPADQELLSKVRQAGLWEMPAGEWARQRAAGQRVREVGMTIMVDHGRLDSQVRALATELGAALPDKPTADQQSWLDEMSAATAGAEFERIFVNRLRAAHGAIFPVIAQVRAGTRDERIRAFASTANQAVLRHITLLESTGLVDHAKLPEPATSQAVPSLNDLDTADVVTLTVLIPLETLATIFLVGLLRNPPKRLPFPKFSPKKT